MKLVVFLGLAVGALFRLTDGAAGSTPNGIKQTPLDPIKISKCTKDSIEVTITTLKKFEGVIFTLDKDSSGDKTCEFTSRDKGGLTIFTTNDSPPHHQTTVRFETPDCAIRRGHVIDPDCTPDSSETDPKEAKCEVDAYEITMYIRFWLPAEHGGKLLPGVHTKVDAAYTLACQPQTGSEYEDAALTIVDIDPEVVVKPFSEIPDCTYCISLSSPLGTPDSPGPDQCFNAYDEDNNQRIPFERKVYHEFHCEPNVHWEGVYCLEIQRLYATYLAVVPNPAKDLNEKNSVMIIEDDCSTDDKLIADIKYTGNTWGFGASHPFHVGHPEDDNNGVNVYFHALIAFYPTDKQENCPRPKCPDLESGKGLRRKRFAQNPVNTTNTIYLKKTFHMGANANKYVQLA